ncbi:MAG: hypothetical protein LUB59_01560 [Candidatus Gastranaerophilales bacterium]|nr:hypothetical protein [Candidatus Gastranaerophilales bacterium]
MGVNGLYSGTCMTITSPEFVSSLAAAGVDSVDIVSRAAAGAAVQHILPQSSQTNSALSCGADSATASLLHTLPLRRRGRGINSFASPK